MFSGLLYLIIVLLVTALSTEDLALDWIVSPEKAMAISLTLFICLFCFVYKVSARYQKWVKRHKTVSYAVVNRLRIVFLCFNSFVLSTQRLFGVLPTFLTTVFSLTLYFSGIAAYYGGSYYQRLLFPESEIRNRWQYASRQVRVWLPFVFPFVLFSLIADILILVPQNIVTDSLMMPGNSPLNIAIFLSFLAALILSIVIFLPYFIQKLWLCETIQDKVVLNRLRSVCEKAHFRCADIRTWTVMDHFHTAAIIGIIPRFRYVMFTKRLLKDLPEESLEAILVHEIGHSYRRHLILIPFIILGMFLSAALFSVFFSETIYHWIILKNEASPSMIWDLLVPLSIIIPYAAIIGVYFRVIFGYFSRLFERQADLHPFVVGTPPQNMIQALDDIGTVSGFTHDHPSWHHFSIRERMNFLEKAISDPSLIEKHHSKVKKSVLLYLLLFTCACFFLIYSQ
ncbi:MAG: M48 family metallopeptidase [Chlamydiota bacterium]|nr:M48 family metallopeptidase [Chlamydiota bacterium]